MQSCHSSSYTVSYKLCFSLPSLHAPRERETLLTRRRAEAEHERIRGEQRRVAEAAVNLQPHPEEQTGFIPFYSESVTKGGGANITLKHPPPLPWYHGALPQCSLPAARKEMGMLEGRKRLPAEVIVCFASPHVIGISHAAQLAPLLRAPLSRDRVLAAAETIHAGDEALPAAAVVRRLTDAAKGRGVKQPKAATIIRDAEGKIMLKAQRAANGSLSLTIPPAAARNRPELLKAMADLLDRLN